MTEKQEIMRTGADLPVKADSPMAILRTAVEQGIDAASIEKLAELAWRQEERNAAKEYAAALTQFKRRCPSIRKTRGGPKVSREGSECMYYYAPLDEITRTIDPILQDLDLSYSWDTVDHENGMKTVTCVLRHVNGHSERSAFTCPCDSKSPAMSGQQKHGGADTYARRYSLTAILGITTADTDLDSLAPPSTDTITEKQAADLACLAESVGADEEKFLAWIGADCFENILAAQYETAVAALKRKQGQA